jgi:asparagine synthase (glutamine-hydrolysing)
MCGITGFVDKRGSLDDRAKAQLLAQMLGKIAHRGKDANGTLIDGNVALAHARLSIVDLSPLGHQPMTDPGKELVLSYNGEIYNHEDVRKELPARHSFRSHSDTETLLAGYDHWGEDVLLHLKGMFAFALHDKRKQQVFLAVDRFAIKPIYYVDTPDIFAWSSELKGLTLVPGVMPELDRAVLPEHLLFRSIAGRATLMKGIRKMLPILIRAKGACQCHQGTPRTKRK